MQFNRPILDLLEWINRLLFRREKRTSALLYTRLETWGGLEGYLHLVDRTTKPGEPRAIATFLFRRKRFNGYRKTAGPTDIYIDLKRSKIKGYSHSLIIAEADHQGRSDGFKALPLHYGEYVWVQPKAVRATARRRVLVQRLPAINRWEERDRTAVLITFAISYELLQSPKGVDWVRAIAREEKLLMSADRAQEPGQSLKDGKVTGWIVDKEPRKWDS